MRRNIKIVLMKKFQDVHPDVGNLLHTLRTLRLSYPVEGGIEEKRGHASVMTSLYSVFPD